jgi:hypothetical protein
MTDFLDRYGAQLTEAERTLLTPSMPRPRPRWRTRKVLAIALTSVVVAVPALAITKPWEPILGHPEHNNAPVGISPGNAPPEQLAVLGVLRRAQDAKDRDPVARALLRNMSEEQHGVRTSTVRLLESADGHTAILASVEKAVEPESGEVEGRNILCLVVVGGGTCGSTRDLLVQDRSHLGLISLAGDHVYGLVPDGVARVVLRYPDGQTLRGEVRENFYWIDGAPSTERSIHGAPPLSLPQTPRSIEWINTEGTAIGPPLHSSG